MSTSAINFNTSDSVITAFKNQKIEVWSITQNKDVIAAGCGEAELKTFLNMLGNGNAVYKLNTYIQVDDPDTITSKTECSRTIAFKLDGNTSMQRSNNAVGGTGDFAGDIIEQETKDYLRGIVRDAIKKKLSGVSDEPEKKKESVFEQWMGYIGNPENFMQVVGTVRTLLNPAASPIEMQAAIGNITRAGQQTAEPVATINAMDNLTPEQEERLGNALDTLFEKDKDFLNTIEKLARLVVTDEKKYKLGLSLL